MLRADIHCQRKDWTNARQAALSAIDAESTLIDAYWLLLGVALGHGDHPETLRLLLLVDERFQVTFEDLTRLPNHSEFVKTPHYQEWLAYLARKNPPLEAEGEQEPGAQEPEGETDVEEPPFDEPTSDDLDSLILEPKLKPGVISEPELPSDSETPSATKP